MKVDEWTSEDVHTSGGGEFPPCAGFTSNALPEAQNTVAAESSQTGVSTRYAHIATKPQIQKEEVAWLYKKTSREVGLICERFNARPIKLSFNFYEHLNIVELYQTGDDAILYEAYRLLYPNTSREEYYKDEFASPVRILLNKILQIKLIDCRKTIKTMKLLKSKEYSSYLTLLNYKSRLHCICAYCIDKKYFFLAILAVFISKLKGKVRVTCKSVWIA